MWQYKVRWYTEDLTQIEQDGCIQVLGSRQVFYLHLQSLIVVHLLLVFRGMGTGSLEFFDGLVAVLGIQVLVSLVKRQHLSQLKTHRENQGLKFTGQRLIYFCQLLSAGQDGGRQGAAHLEDLLALSNYPIVVGNHVGSMVTKRRMGCQPNVKYTCVHSKWS